MVARTLLQQALPTTFGLKAAGWMTGLDEAITRLIAVETKRLAVQLGGAGGTLASLGDRGPQVVRLMAEELGLQEPTLPWHTDRTRIAELAGALGEAAGVIAKIASDVVLLSQTEVSEVRDTAPDRGGSSALPQKRNPVAAVSAIACAQPAPQLVAALLGAMAHEHDRAAGAWHAEWRPFSELFRSVGSAAAWLRDCLEHLEPDLDAMRRNLELTRGAIMAERVAGVLAPALGASQAQELVRACALEAQSSGRPLADVLATRSEISDHLSIEAVAQLLEPTGYLGSAGLFVDRALEAHRVGRSAPSPASG
jgi:3-carboxy-cis,cis-muconate cycloisomerase